MFATSQLDDKNVPETPLVVFHDLDARHRLQTGIKIEFKVHLTPLGDKLAYSHSQPAPLNLKVDFCLEIALLHKYGILTNLPTRKHASTIFQQRKPYGELRLIIDLREKPNS